jgi:hypothetical protein
MGAAVMTQSLPLHQRIEVLLNTLIGEQHVRRSLLDEVCDLMRGGDGSLSDAYSATVELAHALDRDPALNDFDECIERIVKAVKVSRPEDSGHHGAS